MSGLIHFDKWGIYECNLSLRFFLFNFINDADYRYQHTYNSNKKTY